MEQNEQNFKTRAIVVTLEEITPERAADWLESHNRRNRPLSEGRARALAREMAEGRWRINTTAPISLTPEGELVDGQHRLRAVVIAGVPVVMAVSRWAGPDDFEIIDLGRRRSLSDTLAVEGEANTTTLGSVIEQYLTLRSEDTARPLPLANGDRRTRDGKMDVFHANRELFRKASTFVAVLYDKGTRVLSKKMAGGLYAFLCIDRGHDPENVETFLCGVDSGKSDCLSVQRMHAHLCRCKGLHTCNTHEYRHRTGRLLAKAWNNYIAGRNNVNLVVGPNEIVTLR